MQTELNRIFSSVNLVLSRSLIFLLGFWIKLTASFITTLGLLGEQCILFWNCSYMTTYRYLSLWMESNFNEKMQWSACELGCTAARGLDRKERLKSWLDVEVWRHWRVPVSSLVLGEPCTLEGWETSTSCFSVKESPDTPFFPLLHMQSPSLWECSLNLLGTRLQPQLARDAAGELCPAVSSSLWGSSWFLQGPWPGLRVLHLPVERHSSECCSH